MSALIFIVFVLAGIVKGVIGMGLPTVAVALLGMLMAPQEAAAILVIPSLVTNLAQLLAGPRLGALSRRFGLLVAGIVAGTLLAAAAGATQAPAAAHALLGAALVAYAVLGLGQVRFAVDGARERLLALPVGAATGAITALTGVFVIPAVPFVQATGLEKDELVQALGLCFTASTLALGAALLWTGQFHAALGWASVLAVAPAMLGMYLGQLLRARISAAVFRRWFLLALLASGVIFLVKYVRHA
ncbi:sulfite exporter TauE/SafE family protein [Massilia agilis]|uniref:Probable membrane transporter protein n=1 Tax=Massilia agilis TaxID=1811226 RepID=A0ABT2D844_9BURK|nr:sulfite exporter TauE/SafE family protein [Massilia agilis]MCS0807317.1 sulfite exporter TauE/SafE family protein [Massilia agilis]